MNRLFDVLLGWLPMLTLLLTLLCLAMVPERCTYRGIQSALYAGRVAYLVVLGLALCSLVLMRYFRVRK